MKHNPGRREFLRNIAVLAAGTALESACSGLPVGSTISPLNRPESNRYSDFPPEIASRFEDLDRQFETVRVDIKKLGNDAAILRQINTRHDKILSILEDKENAIIELIDSSHTPEHIKQQLYINLQNVYNQRDHEWQRYNEDLDRFEHFREINN